MKKKLLIVEYLQPVGHIPSNKKIFTELSKNYDITFCSAPTYLEICDYPFDTLKVHQIKATNKLRAHLNQIYILLQIIRISKHYDAFFFASFENKWFPLVSRFYKKKLYGFIHNNLDPKFRRFNNLRFLRKDIQLFAFEEYIAEYIRVTYNLECVSFPHPKMVDIKYTVERIQNTVIAPGTINTFTKEEEEIVLKFLNKYKATLKSKVGFLINDQERVSKLNYVEDLYSLMYKSEWVLINYPYRYRISGLAYEALECGCKIIYQRDSLFLQALSKRYPNRVFKIDELI